MVVLPILEVINAARAFAERGDTEPAMMPASARLAAANAADALIGRLVRHHLSGGKRAPFGLRDMADLVRTLDHLVITGDGASTALDAATAEALRKLRAELVARMTIHAGGDVVAGLLDLLPNGEAVARQSMMRRYERRMHAPAVPQPESAVQRDTRSTPPAPEPPPREQPYTEAEKENYREAATMARPAPVAEVKEALEATPDMGGTFRFGPPPGLRQEAGKAAVSG